MPSFSIKDLLLAMTLVSMGLAVLTVFAMVEPPTLGSLGIIAVVVCSFAFIGAGLLAVFRRKALGAVIGAGLAIALMFLLMAIGD